jgi:allantoinase
VTVTGSTSAGPGARPPSRSVIRCRRVVLPEGVRPAAVHISDGVITAVTEFHDVPAGVPLTELPDDRALLPGLVDTHVHINDPGRAEWEGFETATRAAAAGGVLTLVDMPLNSVPATTSVAALAAKRAAAAGRVHPDVDVLYWGGVVPGNVAELEPLWRAGVRGFKCFLAPSGVADFGHVDETELRQALPVLARLGAPLLAHAELPAELDAAAARIGLADPRRHATWVASRPPAAETAAVELLLALCRETGARIHIVHVAAAAVLPLVAAAKAEGLPVTAETCPHYLVFDDAAVPDGATQFKCAPPIRDAANREALWAGLADGTLDMIVSDHSPCPPGMKSPDAGDFMLAWGGIASLQVGLAAVWTEARARGYGLDDVARWMAAAPARLAGLEARRGTIAAGRDARLIAFAPDEAWRVRGAALHHRHPLTPYEGRRLHGRVSPLPAAGPASSY